MKTNAIVRIILFSLVFLILSCLLAVGLLAGNYSVFFHSESGTVAKDEVFVDPGQIKNLEIDWAAGSVRIVSSDTDQISFQESSSGQEKPMTYQVDGNTLKLSYCQAGFGFGFGFHSTAGKNLVITLPDSLCLDTIEIDGAALSIEITVLAELGALDLDGASNTLSFQGPLLSADIDGASNRANIHCTANPNSITIDGASCQLTLQLPTACGFTANVDGLSCRFNSSLPYTSKNGSYHYGSGHCKIAAEGISCTVTVNAS